MWVQWIFSVTCLATAGYHAAALITHGWAYRASADRSHHAGGQLGYELSHLVMALGMAAMFSPLGDPVPPLVWLIVFGIAAAWFAACLLRAGTPVDGAADQQFGQHHLLANLAMLFMVVGGHHHGTGGVQTDGAGTDGVQAGDVAGGSGGAGHEGHVGGVGGGWIDGPIGVVLTVLLAGYFAVHTLRSLRVLFGAPAPRQQAPSDGEAAGTGPVTVVVARHAATQSRVRAASQVVMGAAMTVMFGLML